MKKVIRITESELYNIINNAVKRCIEEDGSAAIGGGSFNGATNANISAAAMYDAPAGFVKKGDPTLSRNRKKGISTNHMSDENGYVNRKKTK